MSEEKQERFTLTERELWIITDALSVEVRNAANRSQRHYREECRRLRDKFEELLRVEKGEEAEEENPQSRLEDENYMTMGVDGKLVRATYNGRELVSVETERPL